MIPCSRLTWRPVGSPELLMTLRDRGACYFTQSLFHSVYAVYVFSLLCCATHSLFLFHCEGLSRCGKEASSIIAEPKVHVER